MLNLTKLSDKGIINRQDAIKKVLSIDMPRLRQLRQQIEILDLSTSSLQEQYSELDRELYLRTHKITTCETPCKAKKKPAKKITDQDKAKKIVLRLCKNLGREEIKRLLEKM